MLKQYQGILTLLGRLLIAPIFLNAAYNHITQFANTKGFMASKMPLALPDGALTALLGIAVALLVFGGVFLLLGWQGRLGALLLVLFLIPVTLTMHSFWNVPAADVQMQMGNFMKNFALVGGLLFIMAFGPGPFSIDGARAEKLK
jgi:putative oxidoreductase